VVVAFAVVGVLAARYFFLTTSDMVVRYWSLPAPAAAAAPSPQLDVRSFDRLDLRTAAPMVTLTEGPEEGSAELVIETPAAQAPSHWSLL
jgi:hypothetical protein